MATTARLRSGLGNKNPVNPDCAAAYAMTRLVNGVSTRGAVLFATALIAALALSPDAVHAYPKGTNISSSQMRAACGSRVRSGNGQTGCDRCDGGVCRGYYCSDGSHGYQKGCHEVHYGRIRSRGAFRPPSAGIKSSGGSAPPKGHRPPVRAASSRLRA